MSTVRMRRPLVASICDSGPIPPETSQTIRGPAAIPILPGLSEVRGRLAVFATMSKRGSIRPTTIVPLGRLPAYQTPVEPAESAVGGVAGGSAGMVRMTRFALTSTLETVRSARFATQREPAANTTLRGAAPTGTSAIK